MGNEINTELKTGRRQFLLGSGSVLAMTAFSLNSQARHRLDNVNLAGVVAYRETDKRSVAFASVLGEAGMILLPLAPDPVRQWRDEVKEAISRHQVPMYGLTDWSDYLLMRDLNAELRRFPVRDDMQIQQDTHNIQWAAELAMEKVKTLSHQGTLTERGTYEAAHTGNLFSWEIS